MRKLEFVSGEHYHIYNRGVDKRNLFEDDEDLGRFLQSVVEFNDIKTIGSIYESSRNKNKETKDSLATFVAFCLNPNHFHFILRQEKDSGISKYMHKLLLGYTKYFNKRHKRTGPLFSGSYKAKLIDNNDYLLHLSAYVNLNNQIHKLEFGNPVSKFVRSSWRQYSEEMIGAPQIPCETDVVIGQFVDKQEYKAYAEETAKQIIERRENDDNGEEDSEGLIAA